MGMDFSSENMEARGSGRIFLNAAKRNCQSRILNPVKIPFRKRKKNMTFSAEGNQEMCHQQTYVKEISEESSLIKQVLKERILGLQEEEWIVQRLKKWE